MTNSNPIYEYLLSGIKNRLGLCETTSSILIGLLTFLLGLLLSLVIGVEGEFVFISLRIVYWAVMIAALIITHAMYNVWLEHRPFIKALLGDDQKNGSFLNIFSNTWYQIAASLIVIFIVESFYFTLEPHINSLFVYWYVCVALLFASISASFGGYYSVALLIVIRHFSKQEKINVFRFLPARTPGIISLSYLSALWNAACIAGSLVIQMGIILGPWGTSVRTTRLLLAIVAIAITLWSVFHYFYTNYLLHKIVLREKLQTLTFLEEQLSTGMRTNNDPDWVESRIKLIEFVEAGPEFLFSSGKVARRILLTLIPWGVFAVNRWNVAAGFIDSVLKNLGLM